MTIAIECLLRRSEKIFKHALVVELRLNVLQREDMNLNANVGLYLSILSYNLFLDVFIWSKTLLSRAEQIFEVVQ